MCEVSDRIMERGRKFGEEQMLHKLVRKNLSRGMSIAEIAEVLDEPERRIREIMESGFKIDNLSETGGQLA